MEAAGIDIVSSQDCENKEWMKKGIQLQRKGIKKEKKKKTTEKGNGFLQFNSDGLSFLIQGDNNFRVQKLRM